MGAMVITYLLISGLIALAVSLLEASLREHGVEVSNRLLIVLAGLCLLVFLLVPADSQRIIATFRSAQR